MPTSQAESSLAIQIVKKILPSPFTIAILLTLFTFGIALIGTKPTEMSEGAYLLKLVTAWESGLWDNSGGGLYFAFQMMLILVLGHILALTPLVNRLIQALLKYCNTTSSSVLIVSFGAIALGLINWGLGLIFGSIIARKVGEKFALNNRPLNYGLIGAGAYASMMTWHMGLSGSATTKSMEIGYIREMMVRANIPGDYPAQVPFNATIGSTMNIVLIGISIIMIPLVLYIVSKKIKDEKVPTFDDLHESMPTTDSEVIRGMERLDYSRYFGMSLGAGFLLYAFYQAYHYSGDSALGFIQLNYINFVFLGLSLFLHGSIQNFSHALQTAIGDVSGILIQFPFYFGILAIMNSSGLIILLSDMITTFANAHTLPFLTFISAGIVNIFIPSGGGQWAVQGPVIIETTRQLGAELPKTILAMAYGDQWTNMLQPFWALPLLGITRLKPQQLLPYSFLVFLLGALIFGIGLLVAG